MDCSLCDRRGLKSILGFIYHLSRTHHLDHEQRNEIIIKHFGEEALHNYYSYKRTKSSQYAKLDKQLQSLNERNAIFFLDELRTFANGDKNKLRRSDLRALKRNGFIHLVKKQEGYTLTDKAIELLEAV